MSQMSYQPALPRSQSRVSFASPVLLLPLYCPEYRAKSNLQSRIPGEVKSNDSACLLQPDKSKSDVMSPGFPFRVRPSKPYSPDKIIQRTKIAMVGNSNPTCVLEEPHIARGRDRYCLAALSHLLKPSP